jgi:alpha-galactosidase
LDKIETMTKTSAPIHRRAILKLLAGSIAGARLGGTEARFAAAAEPPPAAADTAISLEFDLDLRSRVVARAERGSQLLTDFEASEALWLTNGNSVDRFAFLDQRIETVNDEHGPGTRHVLRGVAREGIEKEIDIILHDRYPGFALTRVAYRNVGRAPVGIKGWVNGAHVLKPALDSGGAYWSFSGASHEDRRDWGAAGTLRVQSAQLHGHECLGLWRRHARRRYLAARPWARRRPHGNGAEACCAAA